VFATVPFWHCQQLGKFISPSDLWTRGTDHDRILLGLRDPMQSEMVEVLRELCARAQKESDIETVAEIVDRLLYATNENSHNNPGHRVLGVFLSKSGQSENTSELGSPGRILANESNAHSQPSNGPCREIVA